MTQKLDSHLVQEALALSQAACYASMSAKEHREGSEQAGVMLLLTKKLVSMTAKALDAAVLPEIEAKPGEQTLADFVEQAKAAAAAGQVAPEIVVPLDIPSAPAEVAPVTLAATDYTPLPLPVEPLPSVPLPAEVSDVAQVIPVVPVGAPAASEMPTL